MQKNVTEDLTKSEYKRLGRIVSSKQKMSIFTIFCQLTVIATNIILSLSFSSTALDPYKANIMNAAVSMLMVSIYLVIPSALGIKEISDFEAKVKRRKIDKKNLRKALSKLQ